MNSTPEPASTVIRHAPAKLNLSLRVLARRADGFHEIDTLMVPVSGLHDVLTISRSETLEFTCSDPSLPVDDGNLVVRAVRAFAAAAGTGEGIRVHLEKNIPSGAGLGGGSSDAAATLLALQEIHGQPLDRATLDEVASMLGSDVPFFLDGGPARCSGRGEIVTPAPNSIPGSLPVLLLKPHFPVATVDAYRAALDPAVCVVPGVRMDRQQIDGLECFNDLERPVFAKHRFLAELKLWLGARPETRASLMSGSGSTVFAILHAGVNAESVIRAARHELDARLWAWHGVLLE
ncbi:MAG: 4-(cytidine 5'-diphospho)-2-C-methyl-D-erythritol kinase [Luteolibacter sp.]